MRTAYMDDEEEITPVPTIHANPLMPYEPKRTSRAHLRKATEDQSFGMLLQTDTKKPTEID